MTALEVLQHNALFKGFTEVGLRVFAGIAQEKSIPAGTPLFVENMVGESLFIVKTGAVRITQRVEGGEKELAVVGPGEHLGGLALLGNTVRLVSATAVTPCEVVELAHRDFVRLQPEKPQACLKLALALATDLAARFADSRDILLRLATVK
ncbi:MAG TPA: cyclic nucleotide-binding domain-containing protein [Anaeromyxobacter sp.]|nr:cyclic nucleotide-binding domain-containing protein [Anaeromyxobacter sp.]